MASVSWLNAGLKEAHAIIFLSFPTMVSIAGLHEHVIQKEATLCSNQVSSLDDQAHYIVHQSKLHSSLRINQWAQEDPLHVPSQE